MKRLLSLFDYSGQWPTPFLEAGWDVIQLDIKHGDDINDIIDAEYALEEFEDVDGILAAMPCTDFTKSGAQYWPAKDADGRTEKSLELVYQVQRLADLFQPTDPDYEGSFFYVMENPAGRLQKLVPEIGKGFFFHPYEYAGHLDITESDHNELDRLRRKDGKGLSREEVEFVIDRNAYKKQTGLWGLFNHHMERRPIEPVRCSSQGTFTQIVGGSSPDRQEFRSNTPLGFSRAFFKSNCSWKAPADTVFEYQLNLFEA